jgi:hypothetical protein
LRLLVRGWERGDEKEKERKTLLSSHPQICMASLSLDDQKETATRSKIGLVELTDGSETIRRARWTWTVITKEPRSSAIK